MNHDQTKTIRGARIIIAGVGALFLFAATELFEQSIGGAAISGTCGLAIILFALLGTPGSIAIVWPVTRSGK